MAIYAGLGLVDVARVPQFLQLAVHLAVAAIALLALRIGLHLALLHEAHDEIREDEPMLCPHCGHVVPGHGVLRGVRCGHAGVVAVVAPERAGTSPDRSDPTRGRRP